MFLQSFISGGAALSHLKQLKSFVSTLKFINNFFVEVSQQQSYKKIILSVQIPLFYKKKFQKQLPSIKMFFLTKKLIKHSKLPSVFKISYVPGMCLLFLDNLLSPLFMQNLKNILSLKSVVPGLMMFSYTTNYIMPFAILINFICIFREKFFIINFFLWFFFNVYAKIFYKHFIKNVYIH